jgi:hypothetical protein
MQKLTDPRSDKKKYMSEYNALLARSIKALDFFDSLKDKHGQEFDRQPIFKKAYDQFIGIQERMEFCLAQIGFYTNQEVLGGFEA